MNNRIRSGLLALLIVGLPAFAFAQSHARFSVEPSNPDVQAGVGVPGTEFTFTADVAGALSYRIRIPNEQPPVDVTLEADPASKGRYSHTFDKAGRYPVLLTASQSSGEAVELELDVRIEAPPSAPPPPAEHARFSATQGDADSWRDFTFMADVSDAESYDISFGDGSSARGIAPDGSGRATLKHRYSKPGEYTAEMAAFRNNGEAVEQALLVSAKQPVAPARRVLFSVAPSDPRTTERADRPWADFTFTADVSGATQYDFNFGDGRQQVVAPDDGGRGSVRHEYAGAGTFDAELEATLDSGETISESLQVSVRAPVRTPQVPPPRNWWLWALLALSAAALLYAMHTLVPPGTGNHMVSFEPKVDRGSARLTGAAAAKESVAMRLRRDPGRTALAIREGEYV